MQIKSLKNFAGVILMTGIVSCNNQAAGDKSGTDTTGNAGGEKTAAASSAWVAIFDGVSQKGWHGYNKHPLSLIHISINLKIPERSMQNIYTRH